MAKENTAYLYGVVVNDPVIRVNSKDEFVDGRISITTVRRTFEKDLILTGKMKYSTIIVYTKNPEVVEKIYNEGIQVGDMVMVKGTLCTMPSKKRFICPSCNQEIIVSGTTSVFVEPVYIKRCEADNTEEEAQNLLDEAFEISNMLFIYGKLCKDPEYFNDGTKRECYFQIASNRKRRIDYLEESTDYPWVCCLGRIADEANKVLHVGSEIYIHGNIQRRKTIRNVLCGNCGYVPVRDSATEIVPYAIEYGEDCNIDALRKESEEGGEDTFE